MKHILSIFFFFLVHVSFTQTKLINHKSHSGTNKTFSPHKVNGNFGLPDYLFVEVLLENKKSNYILTRKKTYTSRILIYTLEKKTKGEKKPYPFENTIASVNISKENQDEEFIISIEKLLIKKLKALRKTEK